MRCLAADVAQSGQLVKLLRFNALALLPVSRRLPLAELFEHANLPISLDQGLATALGLGLDLDDLGGKLLALHDEHNLVAVRLQKSIDIGRAGRLELPPTLDRFRLPLRKRALLAAQQLLGADGLGQLGAALIALSNAEA
jgi:hypothetical protein